MNILKLFNFSLRAQTIKEERNDQDFISKLPEELALQVFSHLSIPDLGTAGQVSKNWQRLSNDDHLWRSFIPKKNLKNKMEVRDYCQINLKINSQEKLSKKIHDFFAKHIKNKAPLIAMRYQSASYPKAVWYYALCKEKPQTLENDRAFISKHLYEQSDIKLNIEGADDADFAIRYNFQGNMETSFRPYQRCNNVFFKGISHFLYNNYLSYEIIENCSFAKIMYLRPENILSLFNRHTNLRYF